MHPAHKRLFSWISLIPMLLLASMATVLNLRFRGAWYEGGHGFPFRWHRQTDLVVNDSPHSYSIPALVLDIGVALVVILTLGWLIERLLAKRSNGETAQGEGIQREAQAQKDP